MVDLLGMETAEQRAPYGSIARWAERYGYGPRQIKNWLGTGRQSGDMPPLDTPEKMPEWLAKHYNRVPARVTKAIADVAETVNAPAMQKLAADERFELPTAHAREGTIELQIDSYQREWVLLSKIRQAALEANEMSKASNCLSQQQSISAELRQLERLLPQVLEQRGDWQRSSEVRAAVTEFLTVLKQQLLGRASRASASLKAATGDGELQKIWRDEINAVFGLCANTQFTDPLILT